MKKSRLIITSIVISLVLAACAGNSGGPSENKAPVQSETAAQQDTAAAPEETSAAQEGTAAPQEETSAAQEGTAAPQEETVAAQEGTAAAPEETVPPAETSAAVPADSTAEEQTEEAKTDAGQTGAEAAVSIAYELNDYIREYPGTPWDEPGFIADTQTITVTEEGYETLQHSLDELNRHWKEQADYAFATQAESFAAGEVNEYLQALLPFTFSQWPVMSRADSAVFSFAASNSSWYGGAHPYSYQVGYSFDSASGKALELADVVTDYDAFYEEVLRTLEKYPDSDYFFEDWKDTLKNEFYDDPEQIVHWNLDRDGINVWFNQYELGPYAMGPVYLDFAAADYPDLIRQEYFPEGLPEIAAGEEASISVYDLCNETGRYEDGVGNEYKYSYRLPEIAGPDTEDIRAINGEIAELKKDYIDSELEMMKDGTSLDVFDSRYSVVTWKGITSILLTIRMDADITLYRTWNLHQDGTKAENAEVMGLFDMTPDSFEAAVRENLESQVAFDPDYLESEFGKEMKRAQELTLSEDNCSAALPVYITRNRALGYVCRIYSAAGADSYDYVFEIPGTDHRPDGLRLVEINPQSADNIVRKNGCYELRDANGDEVYRFDDKTVLIQGLPCYDDACDSMTWMERYLGHPAYAESSDNFSYSGFAMGDIMTLLVDENNHISVLQSISYWD